MLAVNEDFDHFLTSREPHELTLDGVNAFVDLHAGSQVSQLFFCPNGMRTMYRSAAREAVWDGVDESTLAPNFARLVRHARLLHERGIDLYAAFVARARSHGISPWLSMRMNDVHYTEHPDFFMHSAFWKQHSEYRRVPWSVHAYADMALDYAIDAVRDHALALIAELLERYDIDGLELDWMRFVYHFKPGRERQGGLLLTRFLQTVREMTDKAGKLKRRRIKLAVRIPARPDVARRLGLDGIAWAKSGLADQLTLSPFFATSDFNIPVDLWTELLGPDRQRITLAPSMDMSVAPFPGAPRRWIDPECVRGFAAASLHRGADMVYLFNYQYMHDHRHDRTPPSWVKSFRENLKTLGDARTLQPLPRRHIVTYPDVAPLGVATPTLLPAELRQNRAYGFLMELGPLLKSGRATLVVALADRPSLRDTIIEARANSTPCIGPRDLTPCPTSPGGDIDPATGMHDVFIPNAARLIAFDIPLDAFIPGENLFELTVRNELPQQAVWVEVRVMP